MNDTNTEAVKENAYTKKQIAISAALKQIRGNTKADSDDTVIESLETSCRTLNIALGINGFATGRIHEIAGPSQSGKTTLALSTIAKAQADGKVAAFINADHTLDENYARSLGVNVDELIVVNPIAGEEAIDAICILLKSGAVDLIIIDSAAALCPKAELIYDMNTPLQGVAARMMSTGLRKINALLNIHKKTIIFTNQLRYKLSTFADPKLDSPCGLSLKFYCTTRVRLEEPKIIMGKQNSALGMTNHFRVIKNKLRRPFKDGQFQIVYGKGINELYELIHLGIENNLITKKNSDYLYKGKNIGKGTNKAMLYIKNNPEIRNSLINEISQTKLY